MTATLEPRMSGVARFRARMLLGMMLVVSAMTAVALFVAQHSVSVAVEAEVQRAFEGELTALHNVQEIRHAALVERCRALVRKPRIHAALEDNALDLLYPSAQDELRDLMSSEEDHGAEAAPRGLRAEFYRFLSPAGAVIPAPLGAGSGTLQPREEAQLALPAAPDRPQLGYLVRSGPEGGGSVVEIVAMPIVSEETGELIAAIVLGFKPAAFSGAPGTSGILRGLWLNGHLHFEAPPGVERAELAAEVRQAVATSGGQPRRLARTIGGVPHLLFCQDLNAGSLFPTAYEVVLYPLADLRARQWRLRWRVLGGAAGLLFLGFAASHFIAAKLSRPVERLAVDSAENWAQRQRAEAALESTSEELKRAARFSADASHQLKTPVTVLRAGLEDLLAREDLTTEECGEISALIHQTYRLSSVIEDLLLLSRLDAGRLKIEFGPVDLSRVIEAALDDLGAQPNPLALTVETDLRGDLQVAGDKRYLGIVLQNLLENARKYNCAGGRIRVVAREEASRLCVTIANTGRPIPLSAQTHIFERFHRGAIGENVPGYGLGLNLARELMRLHQGDLQLLRSDEGSTEFELSFPIMAAANSGKMAS